MKCPTCGAHNPDSAEWCTQCYARLKEAPAPAPPPAASPDTPTVDDYTRSLVAKPLQPLRPGEIAEQAAESGKPTGLPDLGAFTQPGATSPAPAAQAPAPPAPATPPTPVTEPAERAPSQAVTPGTGQGVGGRFVKTPDGLRWRCTVCEALNAMDEEICPACGTTLTRCLELARGPEQAPVKTNQTEASVLFASLALPGLGHMLLGRTAAGAVRAGTYVFWFVGALLLLSAGSLAVALPLLLGMIVLLLTSPIDALSLRRGSTTELLNARAFLWLVVGVVGLVMLIGTGIVLTQGFGTPAPEPVSQAPAWQPVDGAVTAPRTASAAGA